MACILLTDVNERVRLISEISNKATDANVMNR